MDDPPRTTLKTTATSLRVLETLKRLDGATMETVADELSIAPSTAFKHLATLRNEGYLIKEGEVYHVGLKFLNLGEYARNRRPEQQRVDEAVRELADRTDEEVDYIVEDHGRVVTVAESYHKWVKYQSSDSNPVWRLGSDPTRNTASPTPCFSLSLSRKSP